MSRVNFFLIVVLSWFLLSSDLCGQRVLQDGNWEAVILYNRMPFMVKMTPEGKILDFQKELPNNYRAIERFIEEEFGGQQNIFVVKNDVIASTKQIDEISDELDPHKNAFDELSPDEISNEEIGNEVDIDEKTEEIVEEDNSIGEIIEEPIEQKEKITRESYNFNLVYPGQVAIFNKGQLGRLDEIIGIMQSNIELQLTMEAFASDRSNVSVTVNQNRLQGISDYLSFRGIGEERIKNNGMSIDPGKSNTIRILLD